MALRRNGQAALKRMRGRVAGYAVAACALSLSLAAVDASPASWKPERPVEIVVPTSPGGGVDRTARILQRILQEHALVPVAVTVNNKPGGGGAISLAYLNQRAGDGHTLSINTPNLIANTINGRSTVGFREVTPIVNLFSEPTVIAVRADSPLRTGQDFVDRLRKDPGALAVSTPTTLGSINHMAFALVAKAAGVDVRKIKPVILNSGGDAVTALLGGHIDAHAGTPSSVVRMVEAGRVRVLGILAPKRIGGPYAETPTWPEQGYAAVMDTWRGVIGPKGMARDQVAYWEDVLAKVVKTDTWKQELARNTWEANFLGAVQTQKLFESDYADYKAILAELGMIK